MIVEAKEIYSTKEQPFGERGIFSYRIEKTLGDYGASYQRHIWTAQDGSVIEDPWIKSGKDTHEDLVKRGFERNAT